MFFKYVFLKISEKGTNRPLLYKLENISDVLLRLQILKFGDFYFSI